jgi:hypothetical protein
VQGGTAIAGLQRAFSLQDWDALRECFAPEALISDHRTLGFERFDREGWVEWVRLFAELASDLRAEPFAVPAFGAHGAISLVRVSGTQREGGAFEHVFAGVFATAGGRIVRYDLFDLTDLDDAFARYAEIEAEHR